MGVGTAASVVVDLRGQAQRETPEETLGQDWIALTPKADRFGVHSILEYRFITPGSPLALVNGDTLRGLIAVPRHEVWEVFSFEHYAKFAAVSNVSDVLVTLRLPYAYTWGVDWRDASDIYNVVLTRPRSFTATDEWVARDEASEAIAEAGLRRRILYPGSVLAAEMTFNTAVGTLDQWKLRIDAVRYPSNEKLLDRLESGQITRNEMFAALALRFPSPAEAF